MTNDQSQPPEPEQRLEAPERRRWQLKHFTWTLLHDVLAHPICGVCWIINTTATNRFGYWLHDVTLPSAWQRDNGRRVPA